jgi:hypothetical protein
MPRLIKRHRKKLLLLLFLLIVLAGWIFWNRTQRVDMAAYVPAEALAFIEVDDLAAITSGIEESEAWRRLAPPLGAPSNLLPHRWLITLARWTGIGSADAVLAARSQIALVISQPQATQSGNELTIKPLAALVIETHTMPRRMRPTLEKHVEQLANRIYGQATVTRKQVDAIELIEWSAPGAQRQLVLAFVDTLAIVGNDESMVLNCVNVRRGRRAAITSDPRLAEARQRVAAPNSNLFGFIPKAGVKPAIQAWALSRAGNSSDASVAVQLISATFGNLIDSFAWTSSFSNSGSEDRCFVALASGVADQLRTSISPEIRNTEDAFQFVPHDAVSVTSYRFRNAESLWRDLNAVISSHSDVVGAIAGRPLLRSSLEPYGILDPDAFFSAAGPRLQLIRLSNEAPAVLLTETFDKATLKKVAQLRLGVNSKTESVGEVELMISAKENWGAAFVGNYFLMGPADSLQRCLSARAQSQSITTNEAFRRAERVIDQTMPLVSVSFASEKQSAISFVELFSKQDRSAFSTSGEAIQQNAQALPLSVSVTILKDSGFEWSGRSSFGILGSIFTTFAPTRSR